MIKYRLDFTVRIPPDVSPCWWVVAGTLLWGRMFLGPLGSVRARVRVGGAGDRRVATSWTVAYQAPPSMGFSRQEYWSGVPLPSLTRIARKLYFRIFLGSKPLTYKFRYDSSKFTTNMSPMSQETCISLV